MARKAKEMDASPQRFLLADSYLVFLESLLRRDHRVTPVFIGSVADQADEGLVLSAKELEGLPVLRAEAPYFLAPWASASPGHFQHLRQLPVGEDAAGREGLSALGAGSLRFRRPPAAAQAAPAEVVAALRDEHGVLETLQANGAGGFFQQILQGGHRRLQKERENCFRAFPGESEL
ncbi:hypothetical protein E2320_014556 [Naja naja]|nr:hypothetical protein E2320_014556 [Naja naja]